MNRTRSHISYHGRSLQRTPCQKPSQKQRLAPAVIVAAQQGNVSAREHVVRRVLAIAMQIAMATTGDRERAQDIGQDAAISVLCKLESLREPAAFDAWARQIIVRHLLRTFRRDKIFRNQTTSLDNELAFSTDFIDQKTSEALDTRVQQLATHTAARTVLQRLPAKQRMAIGLRFVHDLSCEQIAHAMGCSSTAARTLLSRAQRTLREDPQLRQLFQLTN